MRVKKTANPPLQEKQGEAALESWSAVALRYGSWVVGGLMVFAFGAFINLAFGVHPQEEGWYLQVVHRVSSGEVLYRDIFFGVTPLSVYLTLAVASLFGPENLVVKGVVVFCFAVTVLLACRVARQLGVTQSVPFLLVLALLVYARPLPSTPYTPWAYLFLLGCFSATLSWWERAASARDDYGRFQALGPLAVAGVFAGLCFSTKQHLGLYALVAVLLATLFGIRGNRSIGQRRVTATLLVLAAFSFTSFLVLLPVWVSGGGEKFLDYGFLNKVTYYQIARVSYFDGLWGLVALAGEIGTLENLKQVYWQSQFLLPLLAGSAILLVWIRVSPKDRGPIIPVALFVSAAFVGVFPRADHPHLSYAIPLFLLGLSYAWSRIGPSLPSLKVRLIEWGVFVWFGLGLAFMLVNLSAKLALGDIQVSKLSHFQGALIQADQEAAFRDHIRTLMEEIEENEKVFLLSAEAGFYYLATGLKNPTPFDIPTATAFGRNGIEEVLAALSEGRIRNVCIDPRWPSSPWAPEPLVRFVREEMVRGKDLGFCAIYRARIGEPVVEWKG